MQWVVAMGSAGSGQLAAPRDTAHTCSAGNEVVGSALTVRCDCCSCENWVHRWKHVLTPGIASCHLAGDVYYLVEDAHDYIVNFRNLLPFRDRKGPCSNSKGFRFDVCLLFPSGHFCPGCKPINQQHQRRIWVAKIDLDRQPTLLEELLASE